jgi:hypothetical protein
VRLADDVCAEDPEQLELRLAGGGGAFGDMEDRTVVLAQTDRAVGAEGHVGEIALVGLDDRQLADAVDQRGVLADAIGHLFADPVTELASSRGVIVRSSIVAADRLDGGQARSQRVAVRGTGPGPRP